MPGKSSVFSGREPGSRPGWPRWRSTWLWATAGAAAGACCGRPRWTTRIAGIHEEILARWPDGEVCADYDHDQREIQAIRYALGKGQNHIDTAQFYGAAHTEELVGEALEPMDPARADRALFLRHRFPHRPVYEKPLGRCADRARGGIDLPGVSWEQLPLVQKSGRLLITAEHIRWQFLV